MRRPLTILLIACAAFAGVAGIVVLALYQAAQRAPEFYQQALAADPQVQVEQNEEFLQQATTLVSDMQQTERWRVLFTTEQINGWLAVDVPRNYPNVIPPEIHDPRVSIEPQAATIACRVDGYGIHAVVSLSIDIFVSAPNEIAICFKDARIGSLPAPLGKVLEGFASIAEELDLLVAWQQQDGYPVAVVTLPSSEHVGKTSELEAIELRDGELLIVGHTRRHERYEPKIPEADGPVAQERTSSPPKAASATKTNRQR